MTLRQLLVPWSGCAALAAIGLADSPSEALVFSPAHLIYEETLVGETGFPTTPEVDVYSGGTLTPLAQGGASSPTLAGGEANVVLTGPSPDPLADPFAGLAFPAVPVPGNLVLGVRGRFNDLGLSSSPGAAEGAAGVAGLYSQQGFFVYAYVRVSISGGGPVAELVLLDPDGPVSAPLGAAETATLLTGAPFRVDLFIDHPHGVALGSLDTPGFATVSLSLPIPTDPFDYILAGMAFGGLDPAAAAGSGGVDIDSIQGYSKLGPSEGPHPFLGDLDGARVAGNASGGAGCASGFDSDLDGWEQLFGDAVAAGGFVSFQEPGQPVGLLQPFYDLALEREDIGAPPACYVQAGGGDATLTTEWVNRLPDLPGGTYGHQFVYPITATRVGAVTVFVQRIGPSVATELGIAPGLQVTQSSMFLDVTDPENIVLTFPIAIQAASLTEAQLASATGERIYLRLVYDDSAHSVVASYSLDGEATYQSPFTPVDITFSGFVPALFWATGGVISAQPQIPLLAPPGGALLAGLLLGAERLRRRSRRGRSPAAAGGPPDPR